MLKIAKPTITDQKKEMKPKTEFKKGTPYQGSQGGKENKVKATWVDG